MGLKRFVWAAIAASLVAGLSYGLAAPIVLSSSGLHLGSGSANVVPCDTAIAASWGPLVYEPSIPGYKITTLTLSGIAQSGCHNAHMKVVLSKTNGSILDEEKDFPSIDSATSWIIDFTDSNVKAGDVAGIHVAIVGPPCPC